MGDFMELTNEEVLHIAHLARIEVDSSELEKYRIELKQIMNEIDKINELNIDTTDIMISPSLNTNVYREDVVVNDNFDIKINAPKTNGNYIETKRFLND